MTDLSTSTTVRAAGGVVWRPVDGGGPPEIALVHRPRYDDWSLPKGKLDPGEHPLTAAVREVHEETSVRAVPQLRLPTIRYLTGQGVDKVVHYWSMRAVSWSHREPDDEIEAVRWVPATDAAGLLTYAHDRGVVRTFLDQPPVTGLVALIRHGSAGKRDEWTGPDAERPLDADGLRHAVALSGLLALLDPRRVMSATPLRCVQTVRPLAGEVGLEVETDGIFDEATRPEATVAALRDLARTGGPTVVCSQGKIIPPALERLTGRAHGDFHTAKGHGWVLSFAGETLLPIEHLDPSA